MPYFNPYRQHRAVDCCHQVRQYGSTTQFDRFGSSVRFMLLYFASLVTSLPTPPLTTFTVLYKALAGVFCITCTMFVVFRALQLCSSSPFATESCHVGA